jgi:diguanylate cyclase (GGDEF)-like protein
MAPLIYLWVINPMKKKMEELEKLSGADSLTGLYSRGRFIVLAEQQIKYAIRTSQKLELFFIDVDNLKIINDTLGHKVGDAALVSAATVLKKTFRQSDIIARLAGDEFVVLTLGQTTGINHIISRIKSYSRTESSSFELSMSIGVAVFDPQDPCSIDELISRADSAMYEQKK